MHVHRVKVCRSRKVNHLGNGGGGYSNFLAAYLAEKQSYANSPEYLGTVG